MSVLSLLVFHFCVDLYYPFGHIKQNQKYSAPVSFCDNYSTVVSVSAAYNKLFRFFFFEHSSVMGHWSSPHFVTVKASCYAGPGSTKTCKQKLLEAKLWLNRKGNRDRGSMEGDSMMVEDSREWSYSLLNDSGVTAQTIRQSCWWKIYLLKCVAPMICCRRERGSDTELKHSTEKYYGGKWISVALKMQNLLSMSWRWSQIRLV